MDPELTSVIQEFQKELREFRDTLLTVNQETQTTLREMIKNDSTSARDVMIAQANATIAIAHSLEAVTVAAIGEAGNCFRESLAKN